MNYKGLYKGENAILDFLDPSTHAPTPLVELPKSLNPYYTSGIRIFAKMMSSLPLGNVKSVPAYAMLKKLDLDDVDQIIEASSGNTVLSMSLIGRAMGIPSTTALVSKEVSPGKLRLLRLCGVHVEVVDEPICPDPENKNGAIAMARERGRLRGWINPGQYDNPNNPNSHVEYTAPELYAQLKGHVDIFAAGLGTTGTLTGVSNFLRSQNSSTITIGIARKPNNSVPGVRTKRLLAEVAFDWSGASDCIVEVSSRESFEASAELIQNGLLVGPSSGFAYQGLLKGIETLIEDGKLQIGKTLNAVFICPDTPYPYIDDYFEILGESHFPQILGSDLLVHHKDAPSTDRQITDEISIEDFIDTYTRGADKNYALTSGVHLIDVREPSEFADHHIEGSINIPLGKIQSNDFKPNPDMVYVFVCKTGARSQLATEYVSLMGSKIYSLAGGTARWSALDLPRVRPNFCKY